MGMMSLIVVIPAEVCCTLAIKNNTRAQLLHHHSALQTPKLLMRKIHIIIIT
jgi:hypothetical protein